MKTHILTVSRVFPVTHKRKGEPTLFPFKILNAIDKKTTYFWTTCEKCGKTFVSCCADGGGQIADTGDYDDIACPKCGSKELSDVEIPNELIYYNQNPSIWPKLHTIRANYDLWSKRIKEVQEGKAILSIRYWSGKPYNSKQVEICQLDKGSGVGVQKLRSFMWQYAIIDLGENGTDSMEISELAKNDGLSENDFCEWFRKYDLSKPMAIIHFTNFRY
jgi:DNA-directed RNA polymerase subunit RPC12/RpoP